MHSSFRTYLKRAMAIALVVGPIPGAGQRRGRSPRGRRGPQGWREAVSAADMKSGRREPMSEAVEVAAMSAKATSTSITVMSTSIAM
jgi:hypothetical protein